jgi:PKD repeat protein
VRGGAWTFTPPAPETFTVYLNVTDSLGNSAKSSEATVAVASQLSASISPTSASILVGQSITFTSTVSGGYTPYSYKWYLNGAPVSGATSTSWTFTPNASGIYQVYLKVKDTKANTSQSNTARITVTSFPIGGYSIPIQAPTTEKSSSLYLTIMTILITAFTIVRRKTHKRRKQPLLSFSL